MNAIENDEEIQVKRNVKDVRMPMKLVHEVLVKAGRLEGCQRKEEEAKDKKKILLSVPWEYYGSRYPRVPRLSRVNTRDDE